MEYHHNNLDSLSHHNLAIGHVFYSQPSTSLVGLNSKNCIVSSVYTHILIIKLKKD